MVQVCNLCMVHLMCKVVLAFPQDYLEDEYLTSPCEGTSHPMSLLDYLVMGLLTLKPESNLKTIDFTRFYKGNDNYISNEICN